VLVISHDRHFLDHTVKKIYAVEDRNLVEYLGNFTYFWEKRQARLELLNSVNSKKDTSQTKAEWEKLKDKRRHSKRIIKIEEQIIETEQKIAEVKEKLLDPDLSSDWELLISMEKEKVQLEKDLEELFSEYEKLNE